MAAEKKGYEAHADKTSVQITMGDGRTLTLEPGQTHVTADPGEQAVLDAAEFVKSVPVPGSKKSDDGGGK